MIPSVLQVAGRAATTPVQSATRSIPPTSLYESASFEWSWLEDQIAAGVLRSSDDQFDGIHEALVERFRSLFAPDTDLHFTAVGGDAEEYATVEAMTRADVPAAVQPV